MAECIFCKIINGEIPGAFVHEDNEAVIFLDINQAAKGHLLIVPREHIAFWHELDHATASHLAKLASDYAPVILDEFDADGYNLLVNNGGPAGQEVMHVHLHLIPRWRRDDYFGGAPKHRVAEADELQATAKRIKEAERRHS